MSMMSKRITIGRGKYNDIRIPERYDTVSNEHADIEVSDNGVLYIVDHSSNGTIVNGVRIHHTSKQILYGDRISLSKSYELSWTLINDYLPWPRTDSVSSKATTKLQHARETELFNSDRDSFNDSPRSISYGERNKEIESAKNSWSWGGFLLGWVWALGHACWWPSIVVLSLLVLSFVMIIFFSPLGIAFSVILEVFQIALSVYLGIKGNAIAWGNGCFEDIEHFRNKERGWTIAGVIVLVLFFILPLIISMISVFALGVAFF